MMLFRPDIFFSLSVMIAGMMGSWVLGIGLRRRLARRGKPQLEGSVRFAIWHKRMVH